MTVGRSKGLTTSIYVAAQLCIAEYFILQASMWPSIPLVVSQATVGTAMGLTTSIQMIGIGISNLIVGQILGDDKQ